MKKLIKDTTTYYLVEDDKGKHLVLQYVTKWNHPPPIKHCATVTGRLSGSRPNMQNIPFGKRILLMRVILFPLYATGVCTSITGSTTDNMAVFSSDQKELLYTSTCGQVKTVH